MISPSLARPPAASARRRGAWCAGALLAALSACSFSEGRAPGRAQPQAPGSAPPAEVVAAGVVGGTAPPPPAPSRHVELGVPKDHDPSDDHWVDGGEYFLSYNERRNVANWVAWRVSAADLGRTGRAGSFHASNLLPATMVRVEPDDYKGSGFDRGHLCPSGDRTATEQANRVTFSMLNVHPQVHELNAGPWEDLESFTRRRVEDHGVEAFVVAGGVFAGEPRRIGRGVAVPASSFKVIVELPRGGGAASVTTETKVYAALMPNHPSVARRPWTDFVVSVDEVERATGYDLHDRVPPAVEEVLEARRAEVVEEPRPRSRRRRR